MSSSEQPVEESFALNLYTSLLQDIAALLGLPPSSFKRDIITLERRLSSEGLAFLTKALPRLGKALDRALARDDQCIRVEGFTWKGARPEFLGKLFTIILDDDGKPRKADDSSYSIELLAGAVRAVRQVCYLLYKLEGQCSPQAEDAAIANFIAIEDSLPAADWDGNTLSEECKRVLDRARSYLWRVFEYETLENVLPKHGPGAVATGERPHEKMQFKRFYPELDDEYSYSEYFYFNYTHLCDELESLENLNHEVRSVAKICLVPKDSRGPRIISMEPLEKQWIQQGQFEKLVEICERSNSICSGFVNFTNQEVNRAIASESSRTLEYETLDMKDASDRVSMWLVNAIFPKHIVRKLCATRSSHTTLPNGHVLELKKFAPMGSAVCFPIEALTFWALAVGALSDISLWRKPYKQLPRVYVYGDDIIAPAGSYDILRPLFEEVFLRFNEDKCCVGSTFRESCGMDAFLDLEVTPLRIKHSNKKLNKSPQQLLAYTSYINACAARRLNNLRDYLLKAVEDQTGFLPRSVSRPDLQPGTIVESDWKPRDVIDWYMDHGLCRYNRHTHSLEARIWTFTPHSYEWGSPDWSTLLRRAHQIGVHIERRLEPCCYTWPRRVKRRRRWVTLDGLS